MPEQYRDIDFAKAHGIAPIPSFERRERDRFQSRRCGSLREKLGIAKDDFLFLTVGTPVNAKGHMEVGRSVRAHGTTGVAGGLFSL